MGDTSTSAMPLTASLGGPRCRICHGTRIRVAAQLRSERDGRTYQALQCRDCGLLFADPLPDLSFEGLQEVYGAEYTGDQRVLEADEVSLEMGRIAVRRQMEIVERYVSPGLALNVGAMGRAIQVVRDRGWRLKIVDASRYAAETARALWGIEVTVSRIEDYASEGETFDFVRMGHVIEHLADPVVAMRNVAKIMRPGGILLIDTDNAEGLRSQIEGGIRRLLGEGPTARLVKMATGKDLRKKYGRLIPPVHLNIFSERALRRVLEETGFEVLETRKPAWGDPTWFPMETMNGLSLAERTFVRLDQVGASLGRGEVLSVLARRV
jgi:2-polyprenyl-3-methyl-5-hydroxy-6-metoxy-1,4-benzoquinol methylase